MITKKPRRGDSLYRVWNGTVERYDFVEENVAPGATALTYVVRPMPYDSNNQCLRIPSDSPHYFSSEREALVAYVKDCEDEKVKAHKRFTDALKHYGEVTAEIARVQALLFIKTDPYWSPEEKNEEGRG